jgi:hypothetical protein
MEAYSQAFSLVLQVFSDLGLELHKVEWERMVDEFGNVGHGRFDDDRVRFCQQGNLRIVVRECSDNLFWFEVELGFVCEESEAATLHPILLTFCEVGPNHPGCGRWGVSRYDSQESLSLLMALEADFAPRCPTEPIEEAQRSLIEFDRTRPDEPFFLDLVRKFATQMAMNSVSSETADVPSPPAR